MAPANVLSLAGNSAQELNLFTFQHARCMVGKTSPIQIRCIGLLQKCIAARPVKMMTSLFLSLWNSKPHLINYAKRLSALCWGSRVQNMFFKNGCRVKREQASNSPLPDSMHPLCSLSFVTSPKHANLSSPIGWKADRKKELAYNPKRSRHTIKGA